MWSSTYSCLKKIFATSHDVVTSTNHALPVNSTRKLMIYIYIYIHTHTHTHTHTHRYICKTIILKHWTTRSSPLQHLRKRKVSPTTGVPNPGGHGPQLACSLLGTGPQSRWAAGEWVSEASSATPRHLHYHLNHPPHPIKKLSSTKLVSGAKKVGDRNPTMKSQESSAEMRSQAEYGGLSE